MRADLLLEGPPKPQKSNRKLSWLLWRAKRSRHEEHFQRLGNILTALDHVREYL